MTTPAPQPEPSQEELYKAIINYRIWCDIRVSERDEGVITQSEYEKRIQWHLDEALSAINSLTLKQVLSLIGEDDTQLSATNSRRNAYQQAKNNWKKQLRQSAERIYGKE